MFDGSGTDGYQRRNSRFSFSSCKKLLKRNGRQWQNEHKRVEILTSFKYVCNALKETCCTILFIRFRLLSAQIACFDWVEWTCNDIKIQFSLERGTGNWILYFLRQFFCNLFIYLRSDDLISCRSEEKFNFLARNFPANWMSTSWLP